MDLLFYHRTTNKNAQSILVEGFRDGRDRYMTDREFEGVWMSLYPFDGNEGAFGDAVLEIRISLSADELDFYEWVEEGKRDREWLIPAALLNSKAVVRLVDKDQLHGLPSRPLFSLDGID